MLYLLAVIPLGILFYFLAVRSRKHYVCPQCGEELMVEHMKASRCNFCGAPLEQEM